jgi:gliding motility-associated-like protein
MLFMKRTPLSLFFLILSGICQAQIISPDTVCIHTPVNFTTDHQGVTYAWTIDTFDNKIDIRHIFAPGNVTPFLSGAPISVPASSTLVNDDGDYFCFIANHGNAVIRYAFGNSPNNPPTMTNFGNMGGVISSNVVESMEVIKDDNGDWFGFVLDGPNLVRLDFGNSLASTPTATSISLSTVMSYELQITVKKFNNEWIAFIGGYHHGYILRLDFGASLANTPSTTILPTGGVTLNSPGYFTLHEQGGQWYMLIASLHGTSSGNSLVRYSFGTDLKNNNPTVTSLGNPGNFFNLPRGIFTVESCDSLYVIALNEGGALARLNFQNNDLSSNVVTATNLGTFGTAYGIATTHAYWFNDTLYFLTPSFTGHNIYRFPVMTLNAPVRHTSYYDRDFTHTFTTPGVYNVTLQCDQADHIGPSTFCKRIVVVDGMGGFLGPDTTVCGGNSLTLNATQSGATSYTWNTGATTPTLTVTQPGSYSVHLTGQVCSTDDTINVNFAPNPHIDLGPDKVACEGDAVSLGSSGGSYVSPGYSWSTGATTPTVTATQSGNYILTIEDRGCRASDTITVTLNPKPVVDLGPDTNVCVSALPLTLRSSQPAGVHYVWSNGLSTTEMEVTRGGSYWLEVSLGSCVASDTILIRAIEDPTVYIGADTTICEQFPLRVGTEVPGAAYLWNTGAQTSYINVNQTGSYVLAVNLDGCVVQDTIEIVAMPVPDIDLGGDRDICPDQTIVLDATHGANSIYRWNTGEQTSSYAATSPGVYGVTVITEHGCVGGDTVELSYYPLPVVSAGVDTTVCEETPLLLKPWSVNADSLLWSDGSVGNTLSIRWGGEYVVTGINKCGTGSDTIMVKQIFCDIWVPNAFTPNGDGINDVFHVLGNIGRLEGFGLSVYNRWGERIFHTQDKYQGWDGRHNGTDALLGTYVYMLEYQIGNQPYQQKGSFHLIR